MMHMQLLKNLMAALMNLLPNSFKSRLVGLFGGLALLIGVPVYYHVNHVFSERLIIERGNAVRDLAVAVSAVLTANLQERQREIELMAGSPVFRRLPLSSSDTKDAVNRLRRSYPYYSWLGVADTVGIVQSAAAGLLVGNSVAERPWFKRGKEGAYVGDLHEAKLLAKLLPQSEGQGPVRFIDFAAPVFDDNGVLRGVLAAHAHWRWAGDVIRVLEPKNARMNKQEIFIVNADHEIIYPDLPELHAQKIPPPVLSGKDFVLDNWGGNTAYLSSSILVTEVIATRPLNWRIVVRQPAEIALAPVIELRRTLLLFGIVAAILFISSIYWVASKVSSPLERLASTARQIERGDENAVLESNAGSNELRDLVDALSGMTDQLLYRKRALLEANLSLERKVTERTAELAAANQALHHMARRDLLTGLANRLSINETLFSEFARMQRTGVPYAVLMMDIDHLKNINERFGDEAGDKVLVEVSAIIRHAVRSTDVVGRLGGERFFALLPAVDLPAAVAMAQKIVNAVNQTTLPIVEQVTVSIGVAIALTEHDNDSVALSEADQHLNAAKRRGHNQVAYELHDT